MIGHEISHGFDDQGSQYDGDGNLRDWWTAGRPRAVRGQDARRWWRSTARFEPVPGYHVNGELTLGENIADNSGLAIAYKAYQLSLGGKPAPVIDGLTGDQRFFMGLAQVWRDKTRDDEIDPGRSRPIRIRRTMYRANVPLMQPAGVLRRLRRQAGRQDVPGAGAARKTLVGERSGIERADRNVDVQTRTGLAEERTRDRRYHVRAARDRHRDVLAAHHLTERGIEPFPPRARKIDLRPGVGRAAAAMPDSIAPTRT